MSSESLPTKPVESKMFSAIQADTEPQRTKTRFGCLRNLRSHASFKYPAKSALYPPSQEISSSNTTVLRPDDSTSSSCANANDHVCAGTISCLEYSATFSQKRRRCAASVIPLRGGSPSMQMNLSALLAANSSIKVDLPMRRRPRHVTSTPWSRPHSASRSFRSRSLPTNIHSPLPSAHYYRTDSLLSSTETFLLINIFRIRRKVQAKIRLKRFFYSMSC